MIFKLIGWIVEEGANLFVGIFFVKLLLNVSIILTVLGRMLVNLSVRTVSPALNATKPSSRTPCLVTIPPVAKPLYASLIPDVSILIP